MGANPNSQNQDVTWPVCRQSERDFSISISVLTFGKGMQMQELMNRIAYVFKKGPLARQLLYDAGIGIDASDLAETICCERMDEQHELRYHYNQFAYRMGPEKDLGEAL